MSDPRYPQAPAGYPPAPGYPQTAPGAYGYTQAAPTGYPPMQPAPAAAPAPGAMPSYYIPDEKAVLAGYVAAREAAARAASGGQRAQFVKFLGPRGETKWGMGVGIGFVSNLPVYILPAPQPKPGQPPTGIYLETSTHFYKSAAHPQGQQIGCPGPGKCLICMAREAGLAHQDPNVQKRAKEFGRVRTQYMYQVVLLQYPQAHIGPDGIMRPQILGAGKKLHVAIGDLIALRGLPRIVDPSNGRPLMLKKVKTGPEERDVEYGANDLEPQPLPTQFWPALQNLYDLNVFRSNPTHEDMMKAVMEMGLPLPGHLTAAHNPAPAAPWGNPYPAPQQFQGFQPPQQFQGYQQPQAAYQPMGPPPLPGQAPAYQPPGDPYQFPPTDAGAFQPPLAPQPPPAMGPMGGFAAPAAMPPPVTSQPGYQTPYQPQPGNPGQVQVTQPPQTPPQASAPAPGALPPPPAAPMTAPVAAVGAETPHQITMPVPPGSLPVGRDRCFSKPNPTDHWCVNCPDWIKGQCFQAAAATGQAPAAAPGQPQQGGDQLANLQAQLSGQSR